MKKARDKLISLACGLALLGLSGCVRAPLVPPQGWVYSKTQAPLDVDLNNTKMGSRMGQASCMSILGLVSFGDASIRAAAHNGGISTVHHADYKFTNVFFGVFQEYTTIVYGD